MRTPFKGKFPITMKFGQPASWFKAGKHLGVDWAMPKGTPVVACCDGVITRIEPWQLNGYGRAIYLRSTNSQFEAIYGHLTSIDVKLLAEVKEGQTIGHSGNTGMVISLGGGGYHLHFGLKRNGLWVDPLKYFENEHQIKIPVANADVVPNAADPNKKYVTTGYIVNRGDTLWSIAKDFYGDGNLWHQIAVDNQIKDPQKLRVGQVLRIPGHE